MLIDTGTEFDLAGAFVIDGVTRRDALDHALDACRTPGEAEALAQDVFRSLQAALRRGHGLNWIGFHERFAACEARRKQLTAAMAAADRAEPGSKCSTEDK